jgi:hypothetical protein
MQCMTWLPRSTDEQSAPTSTSAKLTVGISPVVAEITFAGSPQSWLACVFRRETIRDVVRVTSARAHVTIQEDDAGEISTYFGLINMGKKPLLVDQIVLEGCAANGNDLRVPLPTINPPREPISREIEEVYISVALGTSQIRQLIRIVQPASNRRSSPSVQLTFRVAIHLRRGSDRDVMRFTAAANQPELLITCPSAPPLP